MKFTLNYYYPLVPGYLKKYKGLILLSYLRQKICQEEIFWNAFEFTLSSNLNPLFPILVFIEMTPVFNSLPQGFWCTSRFGNFKKKKKILLDNQHTHYGVNMMAITQQRISRILKRPIKKILKFILPAASTTFPGSHLYLSASTVRSYFEVSSQEIFHTGIAD